MQKELEECRNCPEEKLYYSLYEELEDLQRQCYHHQMKQHLSLQKQRDIENCSGRTKFHRQAGHYNPYTYKYVPNTGTSSELRHGGEDVEEVGVDESCHEDIRGLAMEDIDEGYDWDNELEEVDVEIESFEKTNFTKDEEDEEGKESDMFAVIDDENSDLCESQMIQEESTVKPAQGIKGVQSTTKMSGSTWNGSASTWTGEKKTRKLNGEMSKGDSIFSSTIDSPLLRDFAPKKQSGQSIYKPPGQLESAASSMYEVLHRVC